MLSDIANHYTVQPVASTKEPHEVVEANQIVATNTSLDTGPYPYQCLFITHVIVVQTGRVQTRCFDQVAIN